MVCVCPMHHFDTSHDILWNFSQVDLYSQLWPWSLTLLGTFPYSDFVRFLVCCRLDPTWYKIIKKQTFAIFLGSIRILTCLWYDTLTITRHQWCGTITSGIAMSRHLFDSFSRRRDYVSKYTSIYVYFVWRYFGLWFIVKLIYYFLKPYFCTSKFECM